MNYITHLVFDNIVWLLLTIPFYCLYIICRTFKEFIFLYKNNRPGMYSHNQNRHYADRFLEIINKENKTKYGVSKHFNRYLLINGSGHNDISVDISRIDNHLIEKKLIYKKSDNDLAIGTITMNIRVSNFILIKVFKFISKYIYLDNFNF